MGIFKNMVGNLGGGEGRRGGGDSPWESLIGGNFPVGSFTDTGIFYFILLINFISTKFSFEFYIHSFA